LTATFGLDFAERNERHKREVQSTAISIFGLESTEIAEHHLHMLRGHKPALHYRIDIAKQRPSEIKKAKMGHGTDVHAKG
jgi:hypothetical protein